MKRKSITVPKAKKKAWGIFSKYVRLRDALRTTGTRTHALCYTCRKRYPISGVGCLQAGHFIPGRHNAVLIDEDIVKAQCYHCNVHLGGDWIRFEQHMIEEYGKTKVKEFKQKRFEVVQMKAHDWLALYEVYKQKYDSLV